MLCCYRSSDESDVKDDAVAIFKKYDLNGDGFIDKKECKKMLNEKKSNGSDEISDSFIEHRMRYADENGDGKISLDEFIKLWGKKRTQENHKRAFFRMFDSDGDGFIDEEDIERGMNELYYGKFSDSYIAEIRNFCGKADLDGDGKLSLDEYMKAEPLWLPW